MNSIEEKLWNYIDGTCSPAEEQAIRNLIAADEVYQRKYQEILALQKELETMELDVPPMAFTYNVMEAIRTEEAQKPLKATIDGRIIKGIAAFFLITIAALVVIALYSSNWSAGSYSGIKLANHVSADISLVTGYTGPAFKAFLFFDVVLALFLFDSYLRKKPVIRQM